MPIYDYECGVCFYGMERIELTPEDEPPSCPHCNHSMKRVMSTFNPGPDEYRWDIHKSGIMRDGDRSTYYSFDKEYPLTCDYPM